MSPPSQFVIVLLWLRPRRPTAEDAYNWLHDLVNETGEEEVSLYCSQCPPQQCAAIAINPAWCVRWAALATRAPRLNRVAQSKPYTNRARRSLDVSIGR